MTKPIGFDQKVQLHHLDFTANEARRLSKKEMYEALDHYLREDLQGPKSRKNTATILMKTWYLVPDSHVQIRNQALELIPLLRQEERFVLHWGMLLLAYPFLRDVAKELGSLFRMQDIIFSQSIGKKMKSLYGERRKVEVATGAVMSTFKSFGVIEAQSVRSYQQAAKIEIQSLELKQFIAEVLLACGETDILPIELMNNNVLLFPFDYNIMAGDLSAERFELVRSIDMTMVELRK